MIHLRQVILRTDSFPAVAAYPFDLQILRQTSKIGFTAPIVFFTGENGTGKSTLLRAITRRCGVQSGQSDCRMADPNPYGAAAALHRNHLGGQGRPIGPFFSSTLPLFPSAEDWADSDRAFSILSAAILLAYRTAVPDVIFRPYRIKDSIF
jgi:hypothetical protein